MSLIGWFVSVAVFACLASACGGASHSPGVASAGNTSPKQNTTTYPAQPSASEVDAAVHCMRTRGLPNFPNPIVQNGVTYFGFSTDSGVDTSSPVYQQADKYCEGKYMHVTDRRSPSQKALAKTDALKYSACMRAHGVSGFPDPDSVGVIHVPTSTYLDTPKVKGAQQACKPLFTGTFVFMVPFH